MALISKAIFKMVMDFSSLFVGLNWPDVREAKAGVRESRKGRRCAATRSEAAQAPARKRAALDAYAPSARPLHVQADRQTDEGVDLFRML